MATPEIPQNAPMPVDVEEGRKYFWCSCGKSNRQPFCDGSHEGTDFLPMSYTAEKTRTLYFCACKHTKGAPLCDGSHNALG
ncbi:MAG: CDGSH iron-sulfur domain-containing protein [Pseudomonadota bacterium]|nr:CDGSH iron-sulfur domain-containing protein [Pseudomonadota bacterium]